MPQMLRGKNSLDTPIPVVENPIALFRGWLAEAAKLELHYPNAMSLATVTEDGDPDVRVVLLRGLDDRGFAFFTNFHGAKGRQLLATRKAALGFYWEALERQVRVRGRLEVVSEAEADAYFSGRPRVSQLGAWASHQSEEIAGREVLERRVAELEVLYAGKEVGRPPHWSGFRVIPREIEFWKEGPFRLHDRLLYTRGEGDSWNTAWLSP